MTAASLSECMRTEDGRRLIDDAIERQLAVAALAGGDESYEFELPFREGAVQVLIRLRADLVVASHGYVENRVWLLLPRPPDHPICCMKPGTAWRLAREVLPGHLFAGLDPTQIDGRVVVKYVDRPGKGMVLQVLGGASFVWPFSAAHAAIREKKAIPAW